MIKFMLKLAVFVLIGLALCLEDFDYPRYDDRTVAIDTTQVVPHKRSRKYMTGGGLE